MVHKYQAGRTGGGAVAHSPGLPFLPQQVCTGRRFGQVHCPAYRLGRWGTLKWAGILPQDRHAGKLTLGTEKAVKL